MCVCERVCVSVRAFRMCVIQPDVIKLLADLIREAQTRPPYPRSEILGGQTQKCRRHGYVTSQMWDEMSREIFMNLQTYDARVSRWCDDVTFLFLWLLENEEHRCGHITLKLLCWLDAAYVWVFFQKYFVRNQIKHVLS